MDKYNELNRQLEKAVIAGNLQNACLAAVGRPQFYYIKRRFLWNA
jgi:hypothetical protein